MGNKTGVSSFRECLSNNLVDLDLLVDRIVNDKVSIDDGVDSFGSVYRPDKYAA